MLVVQLRKRGLIFLRAQTHAKQQSNKPFYGLFWVFLGKLRSAKVFLGVFLFCLRLVEFAVLVLREKLKERLLGNFLSPCLRNLELAPNMTAHRALDFYRKILK
jgi:hypothetical protein